LAWQMWAETEQFDGLIAMGAVIRGETAHFDYVCQESARGLMEVSLKHNIPIGNGILTVESENQALARSSADESMGKHNKGNEAAHAVVSLLELKKTLKR
ncbi:MAG: 6,7-dimethyl-8-ribityllumazine synthase, partial [Proteobacteria bacterium]